MKNLHIEIDSQIIDNADVENLQTAKITYRQKDEEGETSISFSDSLVLVNEAYQIIKTKIIDAINPDLVSVSAKIYDIETDILLLDGIIKGSEVEWYEIGKETCKATVSIHDNSNDAKASACLQNMMIWERVTKSNGNVTNGENENRTAPNTVYFRSGNHALLIIAIILKIALLPIYAIALIASAVSGTKSKLQTWLDKLDTELVRKNKHKTPYLHSYLSNLCNACGLQLDSADFGPGGVFFNLMQLDAAREKGGLSDAEITAAWEANKPNINGVQFLDSLKSLGYNWKIANNILTIANESELQNNSAIWFDIDAIDNERIESLHMSITDDTQKAYMLASYVKDGLDKSGDEVHSAIGDAVIDWNTPVNEAQKGAYTHTVQFGTARFRNDANATKNDAIDALAYKPFFASLRSDTNALILHDGTCASAKLLLHDGTSASANATIAHVQVANKFKYQVALYCNESDAHGTTLYQHTLQYFNPRLSAIAKRQYRLQMIYECELQDFFASDNPNFAQVIKYGNKTLTVDEVQVNIEQRILTISGKVKHEPYSP